MANARCEDSWRTSTNRIPQSVVHSIVAISKIPSPIHFIGHDEHGIAKLHRIIERKLDHLCALEEERKLQPPNILHVITSIAVLAKPAERLLKKLNHLSQHEKDFIKDYFGWDLPWATKPDNNDKFFADFRNSVAMLSFLEDLRNHMVPKSEGGAPSKADFSDQYGPFFSFVREIVFLIESRGGRATIDKNSGTGTLIEVLSELRPYIPSETIPPRLFDKHGNPKGMSRLADVKRKASVRRDLPRLIREFSNSSSQSSTRTKTGEKPA